MVIEVCRLDDSEFQLNAELIETVEATPDTLITLTTGKRLLVKESVEQVVDRILSYRRSIQRAAEPPPKAGDDGEWT